MGCKLDVIATAAEPALAEVPSEAAPAEVVKDAEVSMEAAEAMVELLLQLVVNVAVAFCDSSSPTAVFRAAINNENLRDACLCYIEGQS